MWGKEWWGMDITVFVIFCFQNKDMQLNAHKSKLLEKINSGGPVESSQYLLGN